MLRRLARLSTAAASPEPPTSPAAAADAAFRILTSSTTVSSMSSSLSAASLLPIPPALLDTVMRRARFAHADPARSLAFFRLAAGRSPPSGFALDTISYILGRSRHFCPLFTLLRSLRPFVTPRTASVVLARVAKVASIHDTLRAFRKLRRILAGGAADDREKTDIALFNALLRTLCMEKSMRDARNVYHSLKGEFRPNLETFNILLSGWKSVEDAQGFFIEMKELGVVPDVVSYNCLVDVYCKNGETGKAYELIDEMREKEISPDLFTYTSLIGGLGMAGKPDKARALLKEMHELGLHPDAAAYNAVIRNFCMCNSLGVAASLMDEMRLKGLDPNPTTYNLFFRVYYSKNDMKNAWRLFERMRKEGCLPNTQTCMFLIRLCRRNEQVELALELWNDMVENGFGAFTLVSDVLFDLLCDEGRLDDAEVCFHQMLEKGQKPSNVSFKRIKILMKLAQRDDSLSRLSDRMALFGHLAPCDVQRLNKYVR